MVEQLHGEAQLSPASSAASSPGERWETWGAARHGARVVVTRVQVLALVALTVLGGALAGMIPRYGLIVCLAIPTVLYFVTSVHKIVVLIRGESATNDVAADSDIPAEDLPLYTVLVPLFHEGRILPTLVARLKELDYPPERLEVLLLIESDDEQTQGAASEYLFPPHIRSMLMPPGQPRTKPRALNIGLHEVRGEYVVVYDAEDQPEPDQLRKAAAAMRKLSPDVVCLQARLNFYNQQQSFLTRLGAVDYAVWYNQFLPGLTSGLARPGVFVPLGGTSNHFRTEALRRIGGWDPYNVTEDCDLGVRLGREGLRVAMLDSVTWEEAVPRARPWIRQRSRWVKGYLQTYLVHMRRPLRLLRELGPGGFVDFQVLVGFNSFLLLFNPFMWMLTITYSVTKGTSVGNFIQSLFPLPLYYLGLLCLVLWNFIFFYSSVYVCVRHNMVRLTRCVLLTPLYWVLMSVGAWAGLASLVRHPFYWAKTEHGVSLPEADVSVGASQAGPSARGAAW